jgi:pimeloyl-ACP methyl ester carboxylesterase
MSLDPTGRLPIAGGELEYRLIGPAPDAAPTLVLLHEGLGSLGLWRDFPEKLTAATGLGVFAYSRAGYGGSSPVALPRPLTYMHEEARASLPAVLDAIGFRRGLLVGHSDGASISALYAGGHDDPRVAALVLMAPHFVVEDLTVASIAEAKVAYDQGDLRPKLARWHGDVDVAFRGWNDAWLDPGFRTWDITAALPKIRVPVQVLQGTHDQYGTARQIDILRAECGGPVEVVWVPEGGHSPHREAADLTLTSITGFARRTLG